MSPDDGKPVERRLLTVNEAAASLGMSAKTVYERIYRGDLPARKLGRSVRITPEDLDAYVAGLPTLAPREPVSA